MEFFVGRKCNPMNGGIFRKRYHSLNVFVLLASYWVFSGISANMVFFFPSTPSKKTQKQTKNAQNFLPHRANLQTNNPKKTTVWKITADTSCCPRGFHLGAKEEKVAAAVRRVRRVGKGQNPLGVVSTSVLVAGRILR